MRLRIRRRMTMLELVQAVARGCGSDEQIVERVTRLIRSGRVTLSGSFAGSLV